MIVAVLGALAYPKLKPFLPASIAQAQVATVPDKNGKPPGTVKPAAQNRQGEIGGKVAGAPLKVSTFLVEPTAYTETISSTGTVRADEGVELQAETNGKVVSINFVEGSAVKEGDLLVKLNDSDLRANLDRYNYSKQLAEVRFRRYEQLLEQKVVTQDEFDSALNEVNVQQSYIDLYKAQIEKTEIRAPFDGVVGLRYVSVGAYVNANTQIATLQRIDELKIDFAVPEKYSGRIKVGSPITFTVAGGLKEYSGRIHAVDPRIDSGTRTLLVRAICPNRDSSLLPGAFTIVQMQLAQLSNAMFIPAEAVIPGLDEKNVFVIKNGLAERRAVETGLRTATQVHILSGLQAGDLVITSGLQQMRANQAVESLLERRDTEIEEADTKKTLGTAAGSTSSALSLYWYLSLLVSL